MNIAIIGAGIAGLAAATALAKKGHNVTVFETGEQLSEFGAGLQISANASRILCSWGLEDQFRRVATEPLAMSIRRWQDGRVLVEVNQNPVHSWLYGYPHWQIYRPDLQRVLYHAAIGCGAKVQFGFKATAIDTDRGSITFADGQRIDADLVIAADGIHSKARAFLPATAHVRASPYGEHCYRITIPKETMQSDPVTAGLMASRLTYGWAGPNIMILCYPVSAETKFNAVVSINRQNKGIEVAHWTQDGDLNELQNELKGWCTEVQKLIGLVDSCAVWELGQVHKVDSYISDSGRFALVGDAAHAVLPHAGQGACMAIEDAASLAEFVSGMRSAEKLPNVMKSWFVFRQSRVEHIRRLASGNASVWTIPDGPQQEARDEQWAAFRRAAREELQSLGEDGLKQKVQSEQVAPDPEAANSMVPSAMQYMFGYDVLAETHKYLTQSLWS